MDLRSVLNTFDNGDRAASKASSAPQVQPQAALSPNSAQQQYREYSQRPSHSSPIKPQSQDFSRHHPPPTQSISYPSPSPFQNHGPQFAPRPSLASHNQHAASFHDARSPGSISVPPQTAYRPNPTPTHASGASAGSGYPFPPTQAGQEIASPDQRHHYPPGSYLPQQQPGQDSFSQRESMHGSGSFTQHQHMPQTPPFNSISALPQQFPHQRSQSAQSISTPTSAHSQQHFGTAHGHVSPVLATRSSNDFRYSSQPPTPLGPAQAASSRPPSSTIPPSFAQPPSPFQQRMSSIGNAPQPPSPASATASTRRVSGHGYHEQPVDTHQRSKSLHSREHSLSVSPRTRVASTASNSDRAVASPAEHERKSFPGALHFAIEKDCITSPAKRKLDDRNLSPRELEHRGIRPPPGGVNGVEGKISQNPPSPALPPKRRLRHIHPPIWAQSVFTLGNRLPSHANFVLQIKTHSVLNGKPDGKDRVDRTSRHTSPEASRTSTSAASKPTNFNTEPGSQSVLGPWEASITGVKPYEEMSKTVADFIFIHVVNNPDMKEITSRGIQFEIEAKLGTLIDKDTNYRVDRLLDTECVLHDNGRVAFKSSMTEAHHKAFNDFLNHIVIQTDPRAPNGTGRVQVHYKHRREVDRYFELPPEMQNRLPGCVRSRLGSRTRNVKARVTYDQKTGQVLNKIVKARVADIDIHMPANPMDCRLSINLEMNWDGPVEELEQLSPSQLDKSSDRQKDRLSYTQGHYQIDLTQVTLSNPAPGVGSSFATSRGNAEFSNQTAQRTDKEHELEIELHPPIVLDQGAKAMNGAPHKYQELIEGFLDNVRVLARKAREFG